MKFELIASTPFQFDTAVQSHGWYQLAPNIWDDATATLLRTERLTSGQIVPVMLSGIANGVRVSTPATLGAADTADLRDRLTWMFALDADFSAFYARADLEPRLRHCREKAQGRLLRSTSLFEDIVKMLLTTNIQWTGTRRLARALVERYGDTGVVTGANTQFLPAFPTPERIARSRESALRNIGLGYRAPYLLKFSRDVASGAVDLARFKDPSLPTLALRKQLMALPGIGPYAAAALLAILGRHDFIPIDTEAVSAVSDFFFAGKKVGEKEINAVFEQWGPHKALAYWFWDYTSN